MKTHVQSWWIVGVPLLGAGLLVGGQTLKTTQLRDEIARMRSADGMNAKAHNVKEAPAADLLRLREDRAALDRLRSEIQMLKTAAADLKREEIKPEQTKNKPIASSEWKHAGRATQESAMETLLWAGLNRNSELLTSSLVIDPGAAQEKAKRLLALLPEAERTYHGSPERLVAHLTAQQLAYETLVVQQTLPLGDEIVQRVRQYQPEVSEMGVLVVELRKEGGASKRKTLLMQRSFDGWKFVVPESAIDRYAEQLASGEAGNP